MSIEPPPLSLSVVHANVQALQRIADATALALLDLAELLKPKEEPARTAFHNALQEILQGLTTAEEERRILLTYIAEI